MRVLVIGKTGQLARCLADEFRDVSIELHGSDEIDVMRPSTLDTWIANRSDIDAIINTSAFHDLRACEADFDTAFRVNALGVANLIDAMSQGCHLYHISTDYVFGKEHDEYPELRNKISPLHECNPVNNYGRTKRAGELIALDSGRATIIRTSSLFSKYGSSGKPGGSNFLFGMLEKAIMWPENASRRIVQEHYGETPDEPTPICVDSDVVMSPTYTPWLARCILEMVREGLKPPLAHMVCEGPPVSWLDFAKAIFETGGFGEALARLVPKNADEWPPRPHFSALQNSIPHIAMGTWQAALKEFFEKELDAEKSACK